jgi:hypothetical protein
MARAAGERGLADAVRDEASGRALAGKGRRRGRVASVAGGGSMTPRKKKRVLRFGLASIACAATLGLLPASRPAPEPSTTELSRALAAVSSPKLTALYARWVKQHEQTGGDRNVVLALGTGRGLTAAGQAGRGRARLDLIGGSVAVEVAGLTPDGAWDVWLVDNREGGSALVEDTDALLQLGTLRTLDGAGALRAQLGEDAFTGFEVDVIFVTPAGQSPTSQGVLYGMRTAFQRLYTRDRQDNLAAYAPARDSSAAARVLALAAVKEAGAAGTIVDADVLVDSMVALGADLFMNETFGGNGRTCATCHPPANNFTIDVPFINSLPASDPLFVAEHDPALAALEVPALLREHGLILENVDGFDRPGVMRSVPHTLAMSQSLAAPICVDPDGCVLPTPDGLVTFAFGQQASIIDASTPFASGFPALGPGPDISALAYPLERTGWGGDGAPGGGTLREFSIGAVVQHFPRRLDRVAGVDFRLPTDEELDALELFQLSLGRSEDPDLSKLAFKDPVVERGRQVFMTSDTVGGTVEAGKCQICHMNAGANSTPEVFGQALAKVGLPSQFFGNQVFPTNVGNLSMAEGRLHPPGLIPPDGGFGVRSLATGDCFTGSFDFSQGFPSFTPGPAGSEPGGFGSIAPPPFLPVGLCQQLFNPPPLVEAADTAPFFHDNSIATIEDAVRFYSSTAFNSEPANQLFIGGTDSGGVVLRLTEESNLAIAAFLRVLNSLENIRQSDELARAALTATTKSVRDQLLERTRQELADAREVLVPRGLHPTATGHLESASARILAAASTPFIDTPSWRALVRDALLAMAQARDLMVVVVP